MSLPMECRDLCEEMDSFGDAAELPMRTYLVELSSHKSGARSITQPARGEDEAYALAAIKLRSIYAIPGYEKVRRISERPLELGEMLHAVLAGGIKP